MRSRLKMAHKPVRYSYDFDRYGNNPASIVLRMIKEGSSVLDVGAGPGSITTELKERKNCRITALDINPRNVELLRDICDEAYTADLDNPLWPDLLGDNGQFDVVLATDVLEHLRDPWQTVTILRRLLKPEGEMIVSIPHGSHCAIAACLMNTDFEYGDEGLLDRTHLRFFGLKNIQTLINSAGLKIIDAEFVVRAPESTDLAGQWHKLPNEAKRILSNYPHANVYQVVLKAQHEERAKPGIMLVDVEYGNPPPDRLVRLIPNVRLRTFLRRQAKASLGVTTRRRVRWFAAWFGISF